MLENQKLPLMIWSSDCPQYSVFLCVCDVNFEEIFLYSMMLNSSYLWLRLFSSYKTSIIMKSITVAAIKVCWETPFSKKSYHIETGQLVCKAISWLVSIWNGSVLKVISEQIIGQFFLKICLFLKNNIVKSNIAKSNIGSLKIFFRLTLPFRLNSSKWKVLYRLKCFVNCYKYFVYYYSQIFLYWHLMLVISK